MKEYLQKWHDMITIYTYIHKRTGITQSVELLAAGWTAKGSEFESLRKQGFSFLKVVQTRSGVHPASYPGVKRPGREAEHSFLTGAEV
jgi:hypothetical protein